MKALIIGNGQIGRGVYEVFSKHHDISVYDIKDGEEPKGKFDLLLVCFPYSDNFVEVVKTYKSHFRAETVIIFSTVPIGTTAQIEGAVHTPVEGKHPRLAESIRIWNFMMGGYNQVAYNFFREVGTYPIIMEKPEHTEALKMLSTSFYGAMIEFTRYANEVCESIGMDYNDVIMYNRRYNGLYKTLGMAQFARPILYPPKGNCGGHCIVPNAKILDSQFPSIFLKEIYREKEEPCT